jgi:hypothetical protein
MGHDEFSKLSDSDAFDRVATMVDHAGDTGDGELNDQALSLIDLLAARASLACELRILLHYFRANAFENKLSLAGETQTWAWEIPYFEKVLFELRRAVRDDSFSNLDSLRQCQILTNLGNKLNLLGRPVEAIAQWDRAIALDKHFGMARGNRAFGLCYYANSLYDQGYRDLLLLSAYDCFLAASAKPAVYDSPESARHRRQFKAQAAQLAGHISIDTARTHLLRNVSLGRSRIERAYRAWALQKRLFLNPLNDIGEYSIAAYDELHLPPITTGITDGPPAILGFYNQMKQEFISARWLCFEGQSEYRAHFSDSDTHLYDTLGIPAYSLAVEKTKLAYRMAYSLLDKVAFFINDYFEVGLPEHKVSFRSIWYSPKGDPKPLSAIFKDRQNWPLRGLYWLSRDIYEPAFKEVAEPGAEGLADLRNHLEHKYCQVHEDLGIEYSRLSTSRNGVDLGFRIGRDELEAKTVHIMQKARAALIYLALAVHREEAVRNATRNSGRVVQMPLRLWPERRRP